MKYTQRRTETLEITRSPFILTCYQFRTLALFSPCRSPFLDLRIAINSTETALEQLAEYPETTKASESFRKSTLTNNTLTWWVNGAGAKISSKGISQTGQDVFTEKTNNQTMVRNIHLQIHHFYTIICSRNNVTCTTWDNATYPTNSHLLRRSICHHTLVTRAGVSPHYNTQSA